MYDKKDKAIEKEEPEFITLLDLIRKLEARVFDLEQQLNDVDHRTSGMIRLGPSRTEAPNLGWIDDLVRKAKETTNDVPVQSE